MVVQVVFFEGVIEMQCCFEGMGVVVVDVYIGIWYFVDGGFDGSEQLGSGVCGFGSGNEMKVVYGFFQIQVDVM